jgi:uncharacterized protein YyaL (SSP411 family)
MPTEEIQWREWGKEAFAQAAKDGKPILLDISAVWCHWCHVMDRTTYSDPGVKARVNRDFIPVRVDNDRRPDLNSRYNMGGWPTTAFLTPDGDVLTGATYLPPEAMLSVLEQVAVYYRRHRTEIEARTTALSEDRALWLSENGKSGLDRAVVLSVLDEVASLAEETYDPYCGGFGLAPKFPQVGVLQFLLVQHLRTPQTGEDETQSSASEPGRRFAAEHSVGSVRRPAAGRGLEMLLTTLRAMSEGGLFDPVEGGFFRYSTTRDWSIPHYEKMLEDNAELLGLYARAARLTGDPVYLQIVIRLSGYLCDVLRTDEGFFCGSQDADESYYQLGRLERARRDHPLVDRTLYTGWNALAAGGLLEAYLTTREERLREAALAALNCVWRKARLDNGLLGHYVDREGAHGPVLLEDYARMALALLDAHEVTGEGGFLERALALLTSGQVIFGSGDNRDHSGKHPVGCSTALYDTAGESEQVGRLRFRRRGLAENSLFALALLRASELVGDENDRDGRGESLRATAEGILACFLRSPEGGNLPAGGYALALDRWVGPTVVATVTGDPGDVRTRDLRLAAAAAPSAARAVHGRETLAARAAPGETAAPAEPVVSICAPNRCLPPQRTPGEVERILRLAACRSAVELPPLPLPAEGDTDYTTQPPPG